MTEAGPADDLPLRPTALAVLAALSGEARPGVEILEATRSTGAQILGPGTLYRLLRELRGSGWIERVDPPAGSGGGDERRQYHTLTPLGRRILEIEARRLRRTLAQADLLSGPEAAG